MSSLLPLTVWNWVTGQKCCAEGWAHLAVWACTGVWFWVLWECSFNSLSNAILGAWWDWLLCRAALDSLILFPSQKGSCGQELHPCSPCPYAGSGYAGQSSGWRGGCRCWDPLTCCGSGGGDSTAVSILLTQGQEKRVPIEGDVSGAKFQLRVRLSSCTVPCSWKVWCRDCKNERDCSSCLYYTEDVESQVRKHLLFFILSLVKHCLSPCFNLLKRNWWFFYLGSLEN